MNNTTAIHLTPEDAALFVKFQKQYSLIKILEGLDAFSIRSGSITISFDAMGRIGSAAINKHYKFDTQV